MIERYPAIVQDIEEGTLRMYRKVTSKDVEDYASHIPGEEVELDKEEDMVYKKGILTRASGTVTAKLMTKVITITIVLHNACSISNFFRLGKTFGKKTRVCKF